MKGLKQMVEDATKTAQPEPVEISDEARRVLSQMMREWSGWHDATLKFGKPTVSPFAECQHTTRTFTANADVLVINPNRVLYTVTPFRLKQEAVLTGALLHEAGHARFTRWKPRTDEAAKVFAHSDGSPVTKATMALANVMEEPRVEGLMAGLSHRVDNPVGAGLSWTMRASAAHLVPVTVMSVDPNRAVMDFITSWALRAGRQYALYSRTGFTMKQWAVRFSEKTREVIEQHLLDLDRESALAESDRIMDLLHGMIKCDDHTGPTMIDMARDVLTLLFPETPEEDQPEADGGCSSEQAPSEEGEQDSDSESGEQEPEQGDGEPEPQPESAEPGDEPGEGEGDQPEGEGDQSEGDSDQDGESEPDEDASSSTEPEQGESDSEPEEEGDSPAPEENPLAEALREMEAAAAAGESEVSDEDDEDIDAEEVSNGAGAGGLGNEGGEWRAPTKDERETQKGAERFLREMIAPSESSKVVLSESPSATVDAAAMATWKAGGMVRDPVFFRRTQRNVEPSPPVKVAILVDVSGSMESLQAPSALLSWALSSAALDLRNFAGRGQQVESCLIHWGSTARVIVKNGELMPGIREFGCYEGTSAMAEALDLVEEQIPGFFDMTERPENRLLVQFTDWELSGMGRRQAREKIHKALAAGVNMLSVVPGGDRWSRGYSERSSDLPNILSTAREMRGSAPVLRYNPMFPDQVWETAAKNLI